MRYQYVKKSESKKILNLTMRFLAYMLITAGFFMLVWVLYPVLSFGIKTSAGKSSGVKTPQKTIKQNIDKNNISLSENVKDFIEIQDWFPNKHPSKPSQNFTTREYFLTIPKLNILNANVSAKNEQLDTNLVHFQPESAPGEYGTVNIFGHSTLPQLYDPKNYKTIFTHLPDLALGDNITITYEGVRYEYEVYEMFVVKPDEVSVLAPQTDSSYLTLITCVPPGTYYNRLIVKSKLKHLPFKRT